MSEELKPCPHCGKPGKFIYFDGHRVHCSGECLHFTPPAITQELAALWWNNDGKGLKIKGIKAHVRAIVGQEGDNDEPDNE